MATLLQYMPIPPPVKNLMSSSSHYTRNKPLPSSGRNGNPISASVLPKFRLVGAPKCGAPGSIDREGLDPELIPKHVAIVLDGSRRWSKSKGVSISEGQEAGTTNLARLGLQLHDYGVETLTVFNFQAAAWNRPKDQVDFLIKLFQEVIHEGMEQLMRKDIRLTFMGERSRFPPSLQDLIHWAEEKAKNNKGMHVVVAADYSGRYDITEAAKKIAGKVKDGVLDVEDIDETLFEQHLQTGGLEFPNPDLLIRTGGKCKLSNFMLWQMAYTELYFSDKLFPDFNEEDVVEALAEYQRRQRRFGAAGLEPAT